MAEAGLVEFRPKLLAALSLPALESVRPAQCLRPARRATRPGNPAGFAVRESTSSVTDQRNRRRFAGRAAGELRGGGMRGEGGEETGLGWLTMRDWEGAMARWVGI